MAKRSPRRTLPSYRLHKGTGQAVVTLNGHDHYLGRFDTAASRAEYDRLLSLWTAGGRQPLRADGAGGPVVAELLVAYFRHAETFYRKDGRPTSQLAIVRLAFKPLLPLYGTEPTATFTPLKLTTLRQSLVDGGATRDWANRATATIVRAFGWGVEKELVPAPVYWALKAVKPLQRGRTAAPECPPVRAVPVATVEATIPFLSAKLAAMVRTQLLTGMRPGEVRILRVGDIDRSDPSAWVYTPHTHKMEHTGKIRTIYIGPQAQGILRPWIDRARADGYLFRRRDGNWRGRSRPFIAASGYAGSIRKACAKAGVPPWHPNRLRHSFATAIRDSEGLDAVQVLLGHSQASTTQIYAEPNSDKARAVAARRG